MTNERPRTFRWCRVLDLVGGSGWNPDPADALTCNGCCKRTPWTEASLLSETTPGNAGERGVYCLDCARKMTAPQSVRAA